MFLISPHRLLSLSSLTVLLLLTACGGGGSGGTPTSPETTLLTLLVEPGAISLFGEATVSARALRSGSPVAVGTEITLSTNLGRLDDQRLLTDSNGRVSTRIRGTGANGTAAVRAQLSGTTTSASTNLTIGLGLILDLEVEPSTIQSDGSAQITLRLSDDGEPARNTQINLTSTLGRLEDSSPRTDSLGNARTRLLGNGDSGTATISATTPGLDQPSQAEVRIGDSLQLFLTANPTNLPPDGTTQITATVRTFDGSRGPAGQTVRLSTTLGRLDNTDPVTDSLGVAATTLRGDGRTGTATVEAQIEGNGPPVQVQVTIGSSASLTLSANPLTIAASGSSTLSAVLTDGGTAISGAQIIFSTTLGRLDADRQNTNGQGLAIVQLLGQGAAGTARVTATAPSTDSSAVVEVTLQ